jgi:putative PEP-CTERM system TPR-repeat lipoprotein
MTQVRFPIAALAALLMTPGLSLEAAAPTQASSTEPGLSSSAPAQPAAIPGIEAARTAWQQGEFDRTLVALKAALRENAFAQEALLLLAELQLARFDGAAAEATLRRALDAQVPRERLLLPLARALNLQGRQRELLSELTPTEAMDAATRVALLSEQARARIALGEPDAAAALLDEAAAVAPDAPQPHVGRAVLAMQGADMAQVRTQLDAALRKAPDDYEARLLLGELERRAGDLAAAEETFGEAVARSPNHWMAAYWRAVTRLDRGNVDGAEAGIALAEAQFPAFVGLAYANARVHLLRERPAEAAAAFERYLGAIPGDSDALFYAAFAANREQALEYLRRMEAVEGASTRLLWLKAKTLLAAGDAAGAEQLLKGAVAAEPPPVELVLLAQDAQVRQGRAGDALALVRRALAAHPKDARLRAAETRLRFVTGEQDAAEADARARFAQDPADIEALLVLAQAAALRGEAAPDLLVRLRAARGRVSTDLRIPALIGELEAAAGDLSAACAAYADALRLDPTANLAIGKLQRLGCSSREPALMQALFQDLQASHPDAARSLPALLALNPGEDDAEAGIAALQQAVAADPRNAELHANLVTTLLRLGRVDAAREALAAVPPDLLGEPVVLRLTGLLALSRDDAAAAARAFEDLLAVAPSAAAAYLLAEAKARTGDLSAARYHLTEGLRRDPDHPLAAAVATRILNADESIPARRRLIDDIRRQAPDSPMIEALQAQTLLDAGRPDKAAELYRAMHERRPENGLLFNRLLKTLVAAGQPSQALALAEPWAREHPGDVGVSLTIGDLHAVTGNKRQAGDWYRKALELAPENLFALNNLAVILTDSDPQAAVSLAERAYQKAPRDPEVLDTYGAALLAAGDTGGARRLLTEAYALSGQAPSIGLNLARAMAAAGERGRAREILRPLLGREFPARAEAQALMRELGAP